MVRPVTTSRCRSKNLALETVSVRTRPHSPPNFRNSTLASRQFPAGRPSSSSGVRGGVALAAATTRTPGCEGVSSDNYCAAQFIVCGRRRSLSPAEPGTYPVWSAMEKFIHGPRNLFFPRLSLPDPIVTWCTSNTPWIPSPLSTGHLRRIASFFAFGRPGGAREAMNLRLLREPHGSRAAPAGSRQCARSGNMFARAPGTSGSNRITQSVLPSMIRTPVRLKSHHEIFWNRGKQDYVWKFDLRRRNEPLSSSR